VVFDQVTSTKPEFKKTWLLQAMKPPVKQGSVLTVANGNSKLFVHTLLPAEADLQLAQGDDLYRYGGKLYPAKRKTGPAPECRIEVSPRNPNRDDLFLHVLTAVDASVETAAPASVERHGDKIDVRAGAARISFDARAVGAQVEVDGRQDKN
jgi:hypothetical protein